MRTRIVLLASALMVGGCSVAEENWLESRATTAGATQLIDSDDFEQINLVDVLDPDGRAQENMSVESWKEVPNGTKIDLAFEAFYDYPPSDRKLRRNRVQERILAASNQRCTIFKAYIQRTRSHGNFFLGSAATITGVLGSILTSVDASRALAGAAGIFSGIRAEFNQELFQNLATQVITSGIDLRRREVFDQIVIQGQAKDILTYTVEAAVKDALYYHGQCSVLVGFQIAQDSIVTVEDPGLTAAARAMVKVNIIRKIQDTGTTDMNEVRLVSGSDGRLVLAGTPLGADPDKGLPTQVLSQARIDIREIAAKFSERVRRTSFAVLENGKTVRDAVLADPKLADPNSALEKAIGGADTALVSCTSAAGTLSDSQLDAHKTLGLATDPEDQALMNAKFELALSNSQGLNIAIRKIPELFGIYTKQAYEELRPAISIEGKDPPKSIKVEAALTAAISELNKASQLGDLSACPTAK